MDRILFMVFDNERKAYEGTLALKKLHDEGSITLYADAVIAKDANGKVTVKRSEDAGPLGTAVGMVSGALVGLGAATAGAAAGFIGGPMGTALGVGTVLGATGGTLAGSTYDFWNAGVGIDFLDLVGSYLEPGKSAVVAEVEEDWVQPIDTRMDVLGGTVLRRRRQEVTDALIARDTTAIQAEAAALQAEYRQADQQRKAKLQEQLDAVRAQRDNIRKIAEANYNRSQNEAQAKIDALNKQAAQAGGDLKQQIERRTAEVEAEMRLRNAKLQQARDLTMQEPAA